MSIKDFHTDNLYHERTRDEQRAGGTLDPDHVAEYLRQHPDFFIDYENLLPDLVLPHHTGEHAISLVERQVSVLRTRNRDVRNRLNRLLETARDNDRLFQKTQKLVLAILDQQTIEGIVEAVESSLRDDYQVDVCNVLLLDALSMDSARENIGALLSTRQPTCGHLRPQEMEYLFANATRPVRSAAVMPITQNGETLGMLAIGSFDPDYYSSSMGTMFLTYIADVLMRAMTRCSQTTN